MSFAQEVFPERTEENNNLDLACAAFGCLSYEKNVVVEHTVECPEDEYILDEETGKLVENPDWFESYADSHVEDVVYGGDYFETLFDDASDYMEELLELRAQLICKMLGNSLEEYVKQDPFVESTLRTYLPPAAFATSWITVYKDTLGCPDDFDNLSEICVPTDWLLKQLKGEGVSPEGWFSEYTADWTDEIARKALNEGVILDCSNAEIRDALLKKAPSLAAQIADADMRRSAQSPDRSQPIDREH